MSAATRSHGHAGDRGCAPTRASVGQPHPVCGSGQDLRGVRKQGAECGGLAVRAGSQPARSPRHPGVFEKAFCTCKGVLK